MGNVNQIIALMNRINNNPQLKERIIEEMIKAFEEKREPNFVFL